MSENSSPADAIYFALSEAARYQQKLEKRSFDSFLEHPDDWLWTLPPLDGRGVLIIGRKAGLQLFRAYSAALESSGYARRIDVDRLFTAYKEEIMQRFVAKRQDINDAEADAAFRTALSKSVSRIENLVHAMPCHLVLASKPDQITMGPVTFWRREARWPAIAAALDIFDNRSKEPKYSSRPDMERYYSSFDWIAEAQVAQCELKPSHALAERMVWSALDCLQLLIGGHGLERMAIGGIAAVDDRRSHVVLRNGAVFNAQISIGSRDVPIDDNSWAQILSTENRHLIDLMGLAIGGAYQLPPSAPLAERFVKSAHWFGLATRDHSAAAKLVMFLMAVESNVRKRAQPFCNWHKHNARLKKICEVRGTLVHGQLAADSPEVVEATRDAGELAEQVLLGVLVLVGKRNLFRADVSARDLAIALDRHSDEYIAHQKDRLQAGKSSKPRAPT